MNPDDSRLLDVALRLGYLTPQQASSPRPLDHLSREQIESLQLLAGRDEATTLTGIPDDSFMQIPLRMGPYEILGKIGSGGMGIVCRARDTRLGRDVALKILKGFRNSDDFKRFRREQQILARLTHPNIVSIFDVGDSDGFPYYAMLLIEGVSLQEALSKEQLTRREAVEVVRQAADAVEFAHRQGVLHRDIKPANILVQNKQAMVTDFGLAKGLEASGHGVSLSGVPIGTPAYMSPEQARGAVRDLGPQTDVWGLGATLFHALVGRPPFPESSIAETLNAVLTHEPDRPRAIDPSIEPAVERVCLKALSRDPAHRYPTARDFAEDLRRFLTGNSVRAKAPSVAAQAMRFFAKRKALLLFALLVVLAAGGAWAAVTVTRQRAFSRHRSEARRAFAAGEWEIARAKALSALEFRTDAEMLGIERESRERQETEKIRKELLARLRPLEELIRDTRQYFYIQGVDIRKKLELIEPALREIERSLQDPRNAQIAEAWSALGTGWYFVGNLALSENFLRKAVELDSKDARAQYYLGRIRMDEGMAALLGGKGTTLEGRLEKYRSLAGQGIELFRKGLAWSGADPMDAQFALAIERTVAQDWEGAKKICREGLEQFGSEPGTEQFDFLLALVHEKDERISYLDRAIQRRPHYAWALYLRGLENVVAGRADRALEDLNRTLRINPYFPWAYRDRAFAHLELRNPDGVIADVDEALRLGLRDSLLYDYRGVARQEKKEYAKALADHDEAIRLDPGVAAYHRNRGYARRFAGDARGAREDFETSVRLDPTDPKSYLGLGVLRMDGQDARGAIAEYDRALKIQPRFPEAWSNRGNALTLLERYDDAIESYNRAIALRPKFPAALAERGWCRARTRDYQGALADSTEAIKLDPSLARGWFTRGLARKNLGDPRSAIADYTEAIRLVPQWTDAYLNRSNARVMLQDFRGAVQDLDEAIRISPERGDLRIYRGGARMNLGEDQAALADLAEGIRLAPDMPEGWMLRGNLRVKRKEWREALADFTKARERCGDHEQYRADLDRAIAEIRKELRE